MQEEAGTSTKTRMGSRGRVVIPARCRKALGLKTGDQLFAVCEDGEVRLLMVAAAVRRAQAIIRQFIPEGVSLVDELLADRRQTG
jgi:AbrB family looped-hinge helix DNA binding protein